MRRHDECSNFPLLSSHQARSRPLFWPCKNCTAFARHQRWLGVKHFRIIHSSCQVTFSFDFSGCIAFARFCWWLVLWSERLKYVNVAYKICIHREVLGEFVHTQGSIGWAFAMALQLPGCDSLDAMMNVLDPSWSGTVERCLSGRLLRSFAVTDTHDCIILENIMEECCPDDLRPDIITSKRNTRAIWVPTAL